MSKETKKNTDTMPADLLHKPADASSASVKQLNSAFKFCEGYKDYLDKAKTEREAVDVSVKKLKKAGYVEFDKNKKYNAGDKIYFVNRGKALIAATIGKKNLDEGVRFSIAHIDSPRLDLKPNPLYEDNGISLFKTHYYGGIRKYQWVAVPLAMHGVVYDKNGKKISICIGEDEKDPVFTITDLLPHLSAQQNKRPLNKGVKGEELNIVIGSLPFTGKDFKDEKEKIKLESMRLINEKYGFTEKDFVRAEIEFVPAHKAKDIGFDKSLLGAYGQDDRVCAYTALMAEIACTEPVKTSVCVLADKEETGSDGNTGLASDFMFHFMQDLCETHKASYRNMLRNSFCLSADVNAAFDPSFPWPFEKNNSAFINRGAVITKYTGARGKGSTSDASAESMSYISRLLDKNKICWQTGELGRVDEGGGGTVAMFVANRNVDVVDIGVPVLSMHSPFEVTSKLDVYNTYLAFKAFIADK